MIRDQAKLSPPGHSWGLGLSRCFLFSSPMGILPSRAVACTSALFLSSCHFFSSPLCYLRSKLSSITWPPWIYLYRLTQCVQRYHTILFLKVLNCYYYFFLDSVLVCKGIPLFAPLSPSPFPPHHSLWNKGPEHVNSPTIFFSFA